MPPTIALVGDYSPDVIAHRAIPIALGLVQKALSRDLSWQWVRTAEIRNAPHDLAAFSAVWVVPASPYENMNGALDAIRFARETKRPFLGTCGGFQHALIEFARNVAGLRTADHAESNPGAEMLIVTPLACALKEKSGEIRFNAGSLVRAAYDSDAAEEKYHCSFGLNAAFRAPLERSGLRFTAFDLAGEIRAAELPAETHPFFVGTLFQPERAALNGELPRLVRAFVKAIPVSKTVPAG
jgi:CTP synthase (UTP-ammonia lyase)